MKPNRFFKVNIYNLLKIFSAATKILISAYACEPQRGSEPGVGWNWVYHISRFHDVWAITRAENRHTIEESLRTQPLPNVHWIYANFPLLSSIFKRGGRGERFYYLLWQVIVYFKAKRLNWRIAFDVIHHVTLVNYWLPSFMAFLPVPFIWGPVGGGDTTPAPFFAHFSLRDRLFEHFRRAACKVAESSCIVRKVAASASAALATTPETARRLTKLGAMNVHLFSQVALPEKEIKWLAGLPRYQGNPFRILSLGNLLHWKGFDLAIKAFRDFLDVFPESEYWLIGEGPAKSHLTSLAEGLGIADKVMFWGFLPRREAWEQFAKCNLLIHPSLHDSGGWVCAEAMAGGLPVICLDLAGPALQVNEQTGFKIKAENPDQVIRDITDALCTLAGDRALADAMGQEARRKVSIDASWKIKAKRMHEIYSLAIQEECIP